MGYCYTMRKDVRDVDGFRIGRFGYAYEQDGWGTGRVANRLHTLAEKARFDLPEIEYVVVADGFGEAAKYPLPIYHIKRSVNAFLEEPKVWNPDKGGWDVKVIGHLVRDETGYHVVPLPPDGEEGSDDKRG